jgi:hypothetical protein
MALPNGAGGYQVGDGNIGEANLTVQGAPVALTAAATLTGAQLSNGLFTYTGAAVNLTLPTVADLEADVSSAQKVNSAFEFGIINIGGTNAATVVVGTGWTIVGVAAVSANTSARFLARKTGDGTWTLYRVA